MQRTAWPWPVWKQLSRDHDDDDDDVQAKVIAEMTEDGTGRVQLHNQPFATAEKVRDVVVDTYRQLKQRRVDIRRKMSLYLANRDTEFILFKPMKVCLVLYFAVWLW